MNPSRLGWCAGEESPACRCISLSQARRAPSRATVSQYLRSKQAGSGQATPGRCARECRFARLRRRTRSCRPARSRPWKPGDSRMYKLAEAEVEQGHAGIDEGTTIFSPPCRVPCAIFCHAWPCASDARHPSTWPSLYDNFHVGHLLLHILKSSVLAFTHSLSRSQRISPQRETTRGVMCDSRPPNPGTHRVGDRVVSV